MSRDILCTTLGYSVSGVERMLGDIYSKLAVNNVGQALAVACERGLVDRVVAREKRPTSIEVLILHDTADGKTRRQIAAEQGVLQGTVDSRFSQMYRKFGVKGVNELLELAREKGWI